MGLCTEQLSPRVQLAKFGKSWAGARVSWFSDDQTLFFKLIFIEV